MAVESAGKPRLIERAGAVALAAEALAVAGWAAATLVFWIRGSVEDVGMAAFILAFAALVSGGLGWAARGLWRGERWPRGLAVLWQMLEVAIAVGTMEGSAWVAVLILVPVPVVTAGVLAGAVRTQRSSR